jgi:predicted esterase
VARRAGLFALLVATGVACASGVDPSPVAFPTTRAARATSSVVPSHRGESTTTTTIQAPVGHADPSEPAPSTTTVRLTVVDPSRPTVSHGTPVAPTRTLPTTVWLPADGAGRVRGRSLPWVVFLHGYLAEPQRYASMLETWAKSGYAVVAPTLPLTSSASGSVADESDMVNEPADVHFVISSLLHQSAATSGPLAGLLDPRRIGVAGHSDGANVAYATAYSASLGDPRVRTVIDLSGELPTGMGPYPGDGPPLLMIHADQDEYVPHAQSAALYGEVSVERWWVELHGVGHEPPFTESNAWSAVVDEVTVAFLDRTLGGHAVPAATIAAAANHPPTATLEASAPRGG